MALTRRWLLLAVALILAGGPATAAGTRESRAYAAAAGAFQDGMYERAEAAFARFIDNYPKSEQVPQARLFQAQAELRLGEFTNAITRLTNPDYLASAGGLADAYVYWTGEAQFEQSNFPAAAGVWLTLPQHFPDSQFRLPAVIGAAAAFTELAQWPRVVDLLGATNGVFQDAARANPSAEPVARGQLLLAQAKFTLNDDAGAAALLWPLLDLKTLNPDLASRCARLLYRVSLAEGRPEAALSLTTNLLQIALQGKSDAALAEAVALRGAALEKLGRVDEAIASYRENLTNAPADRQREAVLKIAGLALAENQLPIATSALALFLVQFPDAPAADVATLTLGELALKQAAGKPSATNLWDEARAHFDQFIDTFTNSPLLGKAYLDRGWCYWVAQQFPESLADFDAAALNLPFSEDRAVAKFKAGDARLAQRDYAGALADYRSVLEDYTNLPAIGRALGEQALYQSLRANLGLGDAAGANATLARILKTYPQGGLSDNATLLVAESVQDQDQAAAARALLQQFETQFPNSELLPQARLAVARTYERERDWASAITNYENWLADYPTNDLGPQAIYSLGSANFQAGNETNALEQFTNFVAQYPTHPLAPYAQWWVAEHFYRAGDYVGAERNFKFIFQNPSWPTNPLVYPAQMMAGRAAVARLDYNGAIRDYFSKLEQDTNCPLPLRIQATFAHGDALMRSDSADTNNPLANFALATNEFSQVVQLYPTNETGLLALLYIGDCNVQLTNYVAATNMYSQIFHAPAAGIAARSQAQIAYGLALKKMSILTSGADQQTLQRQALDSFADVLYGTNLREGEQPDAFWRKMAGMEAAALAESLGNYALATNVYSHLKELFPQAKEALQKKIAAVESQIPPAKN